MCCRSCLSIFLFLLCFKSVAAVEPAEESVLNYRQIYFEEAFHENAAAYRLYIFADSNVSDTSHAIFRRNNNYPAFWYDRGEWGRKYFWFVTAEDSAGLQIAKSAVHSFSIQEITFLGFDKVRVDIRTNKKELNAGGLIAIDYSRSLFNREGEAVWTIPVQDSVMDKRIQVRDLKVTKDNTVTFLTGKAPLEIDLHGRVLWSAPYPLVIKGDTITYHHEFHKTRRSTYMVLGFRREFRKVTGNIPAEAFERESELKVVNNILYKKTVLTVLLEFDNKGNIIWSWDSNDHISDADLNYKRNQKGVPNFATHANAFSENKDGSKIYMSFRDLNRVIRIDKKTKRVETSWGERYPSGHGKHFVPIRRQHGAQVTDHNSILVFNNNSTIQGGGIASVLEIRDKMAPGDSAVSWKLEMDFDSIKGKSVSGGNVTELPNKNFLVCAGTFNRIFEVTKKKEIVWDAFVQSRARVDSAWQIAPQYRCSWVPLLKQHKFLIRSKTRVAGPKSVTQLIIHNTGNAPDSYIVEVVSEKKVPAYKIIIPEIKPDASVTKDLKLDGHDGLITLTVRSKNGKSLKTHTWSATPQ